MKQTDEIRMLIEHPIKVYFTVPHFCEIASGLVGRVKDAGTDAWWVIRSAWDFIESVALMLHELLKLVFYPVTKAIEIVKLRKCALERCGKAEHED